MPIFVDNRGEGEKEVFYHLQNMHLAVERRHVDSGDIVFGEVGIERKTINDLENSVTGKNRHFWEQLEVLKATYPIPLLVVEGYIDYKDKLVSGILFSVLLGWRIPYISSPNTLGTAQIVARMFTRYGSNKAKGYPPAAVRKEYTPAKIRWAMLQCIRGVGPVMATKLMKEVGFHTIVRSNGIALEAKLKKVKGLGKAKRNRMIEAFCK